MPSCKAFPGDSGLPQRRTPAGLKVAAAFFVAALAGGWLGANRGKADEPPYFAIRGARIVTGAGAVIEDGTVVIAKGLIAAVGKDVPIPPEAWVIDGKGLTVYPGLMDALGEAGLAPPSAPAGGVRRPEIYSRGPEDRPDTTPWRNAADELKPDDKRIESWRNGGFTTVHVATKGGIFPGEGAVIDLAGERAGEMVVKAPASLELSLVPLGGFRNFPGSLMGVIAYVHQVFLDTGWYDQAEAVYEKHPQGLERPRYDRTERVVGGAVGAQEPVLVPANNAIQILRALRLAPEWSKRLVLYGGQQGYAVAEAIAASKVPVLVSLKWPEREKDADPDAEEPLRVLRFRDRAPSTPAALEKAGARFAFYSDGLATPKEMLKNAKRAMDAGLSEDAALGAFTLRAAEILGVADRLGSIEPGKVANLVLADGDLFSEKTKVKLMFVDGKHFEVREAERPKEPPKANLTGKWTLSFTSPEGPEEATADLVMASDGTLSGTFSGKRGTQTLSSGWVSGDKFSFTISVPHEEGSAEATFSGTVEGNTMKGTISVGGILIDFTGTRPGGQRARAGRD